MRFISLLVFFISNSALGAERNHGCDLSNTPSLPNVVLVGELHRDKISNEIREQILKMGASGKFPVASEVSINQTGGAFEPSLRPLVAAKLGQDGLNNNIHGIESSIPSGLLNSYNGMIRLIGKEETPSQTILKTIYSEPIFSTSSYAFAKLTEKRNLLPRRQRDLVTSIDEMKTSKEYLNADKQRKITLIKGMLEKFDDETKWAIAKAHHLEVVNMINEKFQSYFGNQPVPTITNRWEKLRFGCDSSFNCMFSQRAEDIIVTYRDRDMAYNVADLLCYYAGRSSHIFVLIGENHISGMSSWLNKLSKDKVGILAYKSANGRDKEAISRAIQSAKFSSDSIPKIKQLEPSSLGTGVTK